MSPCRLIRSRQGIQSSFTYTLCACTDNLQNAIHRSSSRIQKHVSLRSSDLQRGEPYSVLVWRPSTTSSAFAERRNCLYHVSPVLVTIIAGESILTGIGTRKLWRRSIGSTQKDNTSKLLRRGRSSQHLNNALHAIAVSAVFS